MRKIIDRTSEAVVASTWVRWTIKEVVNRYEIDENVLKSFDPDDPIVEHFDRKLAMVGNSSRGMYVHFFDKRNSSSGQDREEYTSKMALEQVGVRV